MYGVQVSVDSLVHVPPGTLVYRRTGGDYFTKPPVPSTPLFVDLSWGAGAGVRVWWRNIFRNTFRKLSKGETCLTDLNRVYSLYYSRECFSNVFYIVKGQKDVVGLLSRVQLKILYVFLSSLLCVCCYTLNSVETVSYL